MHTSTQLFPRGWVPWRTTVVIAAAIGAQMLAAPLAAQTADTLTLPLRTEALSRAVGYRYEHLRLVPIDGCTMWRALGQAPGALLPAKSPITLAMGADSTRACQQLAGTPADSPRFMVSSIRREGNRVIVTATVDNGGERFTEVHTLVITSGRDDPPRFYHESVCQRDFIFT